MTLSATIEINGKLYNAETGRPINNIDGISRAATKKHHAKRAGTHVRKLPQKSKTLMRPAVKHKKLSTETTKKETSAALTLGGQKQGRFERAKKVQKSPLISRFNPNEAPKKIVKQLTNLDVQKPISQPEKEEPIIDRFEQAVLDASSHLEEFVEDGINKARKRKLAFVSVSVFFLLVIGLAAYKFIPEAKVKIASERAGFSASLPNYSPPGYSLTGNIGANPGEVTLAYKSRTDNKDFKITQTPSNWNSQSLLNNFLLSSRKLYKPYKQNGKTIYIYDDLNATWVNGGIWYKLEGNANLNSDQLLRIADSL